MLCLYIFMFSPLTYSRVSVYCDNMWSAAINPLWFISGLGRVHSKQCRWSLRWTMPLWHTVRETLHQDMRDSMWTGKNRFEYMVVSDYRICVHLETFHFHRKSVFGHTGLWTGNSRGPMLLLHCCHYCPDCHNTRSMPVRWRRRNCMWWLFPMLHTRHGMWQESWLSWCVGWTELPLLWTWRGDWCKWFDYWECLDIE